MASPARPALCEFAPGAVWVWSYPVRYFGLDLSARATLMRLADGRVILHSPGEISDALKPEIEAIGPVGWIVAPGNFHHLHVAAAQRAFPAARTLICPGVEDKEPRLAFDALLGDRPIPEWQGQIDQVLVRGNRVIREVAFLHRASRTLVLTDLIELIGDTTPGVGWGLKFWWKVVFRMWNRALPAPEYRMGWRDRKAAARSLARILDWDFERIVISHGDLISENAREVARAAWASVLHAAD